MRSLSFRPPPGGVPVILADILGVRAYDDAANSWVAIAARSELYGVDDSLQLHAVPGGSDDSGQRVLAHYRFVADIIEVHKNCTIAAPPAFPFQGAVRVDYKRILDNLCHAPILGHGANLGTAVAMSVFELVLAIVGVAGTLAGAALGAWVTLRVHAKQQAHDERNRKREAYAKLLEQISKLRRSLDERLQYYREPDSPFDESIERQAAFQAQARLGWKAQTALEEMPDSLSLLISEQAIGALNSMLSELWHAREANGGDTAGYVADALKHVEAATLAIRTEARRDIGAS